MHHLACFFYTVSFFFSDKKRHVSSSGNMNHVAFYSRLTHKKPHLYAGQDIVYNEVTMDLGGAYLDSRRTFVAPTEDIYVFTASMLATDKTADAKITKNGHGIVYMHSKPWKQASQHVHLIAGDDMSVSRKLLQRH